MLGLNDGPTRWFKKFSDRFCRFDTILAVTDSQPASHVAVAITLNAKASSLKIRNIHFLGNLILSTSCEFYYNDVTVTSFINIKYGDVAVEVVP